MMIKKEKSELSIYQSKDVINIPISWSEGIDIEHKKSDKKKKIEKWLIRSAFVFGTAEAIYIGSQFYKYGFDLFNWGDLVDLTEVTVHAIEFGLVPLLYTIGFKLKKKDNFLNQYLYLDQKTVMIKISFFKKYSILLEDILSYEFKINKYNQNYLVFTLKEGKTISIKWYQGALLKEQKVVSDAFFKELKQRIK